LLTVLSQIAQHMAPVAVDNQSARRDGDDQITAFPAMTVIAPSGAAVLGPPVLAMNDIGQVIGAGNGANDDIAAVPAVTAIGTAARDVLFSAETATTPAAVAPLDEDGDTIDKHTLIRESWIPSAWLFS
jgi:hypothetical protein